MEAIGRCCRDAYTRPFDRQKVIYICGAVGGALLVVLVIVTISVMSSNPAAPTPDPKGSEALTKAPLIVGFNNFPQNLKAFTKNKVSTHLFERDVKNDTQFATCTTCQTDYPKLSAGKVAVQIWSANIDCSAQYKDAVSQTFEQIDLIQRFISLNPTTLTSASSYSGIETGFSKHRAMVGSLISVNGGHSIDSRLGVLRMFYQLGVRVMAIASDCNTPWAFSYAETATKASDTGLNDFGKSVITEMNRLGMIVDLTGSSHQTQLSALAMSKAPVIFSHSAAYGQFADKNNLNVQDDVLTKLKDNKGLVMVTFSPKASADDGKNITMKNISNHIDYLKQKIGAESIGIGGAYDVDTEYPTGLSDISTIGTLFDSLHTDYKWTIPELEGLAGKNFLRVLKSVETYRDSLVTSPADESWENKTDITTADPDKNLTCYTDFTTRYPA